jgi:hypothetical protein
MSDGGNSIADSGNMINNT